MKKLFTGKKEELTEAMKDRGTRQLLRLDVVIDVLFALLIFTLIQFMPRPDVDHFTRETITKAFAESYINYVVILIGMVLILIYWNQNNMLSGNLDRTDGRHATINILMVFSLMLYLYFVRIDTEIGGVDFILALQSVSLSLAGFLSIYSWHYAIKNKLISDKVTRVEQDAVYLKLLPEPIVAAITLPLSSFGAEVWSLGWLLLFPVGWLLKRYRSRIRFLALKAEKGEKKG